MSTNKNQNAYEAGDELINPDITIWQFFAVQAEMREGHLDGDPSDPEAVARHLTPIGEKGPEETPSVSEIVEIARQSRDYMRTYHVRS